MATIDAISNLSADIPEHKARLAANILAGACLLDTVDISRAQVVNLPTTHNQALIIPVPEISQFTMPAPCKGRNGHTWALLHGTSVLAAQCILLEGFTRPADWTYHQDYTGGASFQHSEHTHWDWRSIGVTPTLTGQLLTCCWTEPQRKAKDNFRCSSEPFIEGKSLSLHAGGSDMAQLKIPSFGVVTTSEKHTLTHSKHRTLLLRVDLGPTST